MPNWHGMFYLDGRPQYAHRLVWEWTYGPIPKGSQVNHRCDVPHCVNPEHLFLGTQGDNVRDAAAKGRYSVPHRSRLRKLTDSDVAQVIAMWRGGMKQIRLAERFQVTKGCINKIVNGKARVHNAPQLKTDQRKAS